MPITIQCPDCSARLKVGGDAAGQTVSCPKCGTEMVVPVADIEDAEVVGEQPPRKKPAKAPPPKKRPARRADDEDDEDDEPRAKKGPPVAVIVAVAALLVAGVGAACLFAFRGKEKETATTTTGSGGGGSGGGTPTSGTTGGVGKVQPKSVTAGSWRHFKAGQPGFTVLFPFGSPIENVYSGGIYGDDSRRRRELPAVQDAFLYSSQRWGKDETGKEGITHEFGIVRIWYRDYSTPEGRKKAFDEAVKGFSVYVPGLTASAPKPVTWAEQPAQEIAYAGEPGAGGKRRQVTVRTLTTEYEGFIGFIRDPGDLEPRDVPRFFDEFRLVTPAEAKMPPKKKKDPPVPAPTLPPAPSGWVPYTEFGQRFVANIPPGGMVAADGKRGLAHVPEMAPEKLKAGVYFAVAYPERGLTLSVRLLTFGKATPEEMAGVMKDYAARIAEPWQKGATATPLKWGTTDAFEDAAEGPNGYEVRRYTFNGATGMVVALRGSKKAEFDALKGPIFANFLPSGTGGGVGYSIPQKDWHVLKSIPGMYRIELPTEPAPAPAIEKVVTDAGATGEIHTATDGPITYHVGFVRYPENSTATARRQIREKLVAAVTQETGALPKPLQMGAGTVLQPRWDNYQRPGTATKAGFDVNVHEQNGGFRFAAARGIEVFRNSNRNVAMQRFEPIY